MFGDSWSVFCKGADGAGQRSRRGALARVIAGISAVALPAMAVLSPVGASVAAADAGSATITPRGPASVASWASYTKTSLQLALPAGAQAGDVLIASLGFGRIQARSQPRLTEPNGWSLASRTEQGPDRSLTKSGNAVAVLAVYSHVLVAGETSFVWTTDQKVGGVGFLAAFGGVDRSSPVDRSLGQVSSPGLTTISTPSITTTTPGSVLVASFFGQRRHDASTTWSPPAGMTEIGDAVNTSWIHSATIDHATQDAAGESGAKTATASTSQDWALAALTALRPATPVPLPPAIRDVAAGAVTMSGATITWLTDQPADSQVEYGPSTAYGSSTALDATLVTSHTAVLTGLASDTTYHVRVKSRNAAGLLSTSDERTFRTLSTVVPLVIDTDLFSSAADVGALATAFGLQLRGEARVLAIGVNSRTSRPAVATDSWRCVAAITQFYGSGSVPIGTALPNDGTEVSIPDFVGPCASLAASSTPAPASAVEVFRRALAGQADGTVVMVEIGYLQNLAALLDSLPDAISPLGGRDLVAAKVRQLVVMGGGYPSRPGENNLVGDPAAAAHVASAWPTKLVWSGYEVGDLVHVGDTLATSHPVGSPVRTAYLAFVGPGNWYYSYDLTAIYHAVRPDDALLREIGPGTNVVDATGGNVFSLGAGNQHYLQMDDPVATGLAIEKLVDILPSVPAGPSDTFDAALGPQAQSPNLGKFKRNSHESAQVSGGGESQPMGAWREGQAGGPMEQRFGPVTVGSRARSTSPST